MTKIVKFKELRAYGVLYSRTHIDRLEKAGKFPKRVALGTYRMGWLESEISSWMRTQVAGRSREPGALGSTGKIETHGKRKPPRVPKTDPLTC
jgi:prophage regulatory protein